ncbi:nucleoside triphosphate pyrophosphohydrolase [Fictibacillus nanhaiensis]|uniref:nucleoside triphosphate pyrophosphohydrolase n=1 Tax=Fictibacillus nanhaiensis TaxID=742169 RepID=UPI001C9682C7|nr:nucleoside triphosphate pyrophosphohydrolase [Fictibacillus nanhaiensis]MBY6038520.1 nucleoside triphosphate pyrophosphohydrolase [Fictibacillus nanhaiensis]
MKKITVIGLGAGDLDQMTLGIYRMLENAQTVYARTKHHPAIEELSRQGKAFVTFDDIYEKHDQFEPVYKEIAETLFQAAHTYGDVLYAVPGHPLVAEQAVQILLHTAHEHGVEVSVAGGKSFLDEMYTALKIDPIEGCQILDGTSLKKEEIQIRHHLVIVQVYDAFIASDVKLTLMEKYPDNYEVSVVTAAGSSDETIFKVPLYELDQTVTLNNLTAVYVPPVHEETLMYRDFSFLKQVIEKLRGPGGCPWDQKQTHVSLKKYLIEEAYEVLDAIDEEDDEALAEELGDVLLQVLLHAEIGEEEGFFSMDDVISTLTEKMIRRHPHVFGDTSAADADEVVANWDAIKAQESGKEDRESLLDGVPKGIPAIQKAYLFQKKAAKVGFDWKEAEPVYDKILEELKEFQDAEGEEQLKELGDLLFSVVNLARFYKIDPEEALNATNKKFYKRFRYIESALKEKNLSFEDVTLEEMDRFWNEAK